MTRKDRERMNQCAAKKCYFYRKNLCLVFWGNACREINGNKIPRIKGPDPEAEQSHSKDKIYSSYDISTRRPYFMSGGNK